MKRCFIEGMSDRYVKWYVRERQPESLAEAYQLENDAQVNVQMANDRQRNEREPMNCKTVAAQEAAAQSTEVQEVKQEVSTLKNMLELLISRDQFQVDAQHAPPQRLDSSYQQSRNQNFRAHDRYPAYGPRTQFHSGPPRPPQGRGPMQPPPQ